MDEVDGWKSQKGLAGFSLGVGLSGLGSWMGTHVRAKRFC